MPVLNSASCEKQQTHASAAKQKTVMTIMFHQQIERGKGKNKYSGTGEMRRF